MWIDAICIDQNSFTERNHQVGIMKYIFQNASTTFSWLGPATEESDWLFDTMNRAKGSKEQIDSIVDEYFLEASLQPTSDSALPTMRFYENILKLARREYWGRLWILQELVLGPRVLFLSGQKTLKLDVFTRWLDTLDMTLMHSEKRLRLQMRSTMLAKMLTARKVQFFTSTFEDLFEEFGGLKCSLKHDKIYALMSLLSSADNLNNKLQIRYEQPSYIVLRNILSTGRLRDPISFTRKALKELAVDALSKDLLRSSSPGHYIDYRTTWVEMEVREDRHDLAFLCYGLSSSNRLEVIHGRPLLSDRSHALSIVKVTAWDMLTQHLIVSWQDTAKKIMLGALMKPASRLRNIPPLLDTALHVAVKTLCQRSYVANIMGRHNVGDLRIRTRDRASLPQSMLLKFPTHIFAAWVYICDLCDTYAHSDGSASELSPELGARLRNWINDTQQVLNRAIGDGYRRGFRAFRSACDATSEGGKARASYIIPAVAPSTHRTQGFWIKGDSQR
jgi:hypothetical protein